jgi:hypothetical protein
MNKESNYRQLKKKAIIAKIPGIALTSVGGVCLIGSLPFFLIRQDKSSINYKDNKKIMQNIGTVFAVAGGVLEIASIPFWIKGSRIMRKAREVKISTSTTIINTTYNHQFISNRQIGLSLCIGLGN